MIKFSLENVSLKFGDVSVLQDITLELEAGVITSLLGISGSGKSTIMKMLTKQIMPTSGTCNWYFDTKEENTSVVYQNPTVLPWKTVRDNLAISSLPSDISQIPKISEEIGLQNALDQYPSELSGGMMQRLEFGRVLMRKPNNIFFDEPFNSLDVHYKRSVHSILAKIKEVLKPTVLLITHDIDEAWLLSDRIFILSGKPANKIYCFTKNKNDEVRQISQIKKILESEFSKFGNGV